MKTRNGKIARLPLEIREQLNSRLADGEPGKGLVEWLNSKPEVIKVMAEHFDARPITEQNLSEWRAGGYEEWLSLQAFLHETRVLSENAGEVSDTGISSDHLHIVLLAHHAHLLQNLEIMPQEEFHTRLNTVKKLTASVMNLRRDELARMRFQLQRERLELQREKLNMKSASSSKSTASTSRNTRPDATDTPQATTCGSPSGPDIPSSVDPRSPESAAPPLSVPAGEFAPKTPPLVGRIQSDSYSFVTHSPGDALFCESDPLGLTLIQPPKLAA